ncbi:glycoside hydrolase family 9 protein [Lamprobacter modestohalophilus]|uniref:glycoside hydrolase family 9 protein n=1 Tax=Lamprobacter modestohalophilus TaxID=1064514 RepID=UPI002ADEC6E3|nr:glycoside hydrolase family 9 protein [Lamprobacter modestohalophilus]MEA1048321.1 glycoside hydrolase family 9 protein [Lamprobacter modestohalophilus]
MSFGTMDDPIAFDIDEIRLIDERRPLVLGWEVLSNRVLAINVEDLDQHALGAPGDFVVTRSDESGYAWSGLPVAVGSSRSAVSVLDSGLGIREQSRIYLTLPESLSTGQGYRVSLDGLVSPTGLGMTEPYFDFIYESPSGSSSIKVNQVGYARAATKIAFVGNWLGDAGPMPVDGLVFDVINAQTNQVVYTGELNLRQANDVQSGEDVYTADFSAVTQAGSYRIAVPGIGQSYAFEIRDDIYDDLYRTTMRVFYHKRNTRLSAPYAEPGFEREGIDPLLNALLHPILAEYPLSRGETAFSFKPIRAGWYDAGDYGQYIHNAAPVWGLFGLAFDLAAPGQFTDGELNIPESGNGIPDILDELDYGMTWALSMQDSDGGVYWRVTPAGWDLGLPADADEPRYVYEKTTRATGQFAAMGAIFSRLIRPYDADRADQVLAAALEAWDYTQSHPFWPPEGTLYQNPEELPGGGEYASRTAKPDLLWAAAELYRTTGDARFQDHYRRLLEEVSVDLSGAPFTTFAQWAMVKAGQPNRDILLLEQARRMLATAADIKLERAQQSSYRSPKHPYIGFTGWSNFSASPMWSLPLLQAYYLTAQPVYQDLAWQVVDIMLGANPLSQVFLTGIGERSVQDPLDRVFLNDDNAEPLPGVPVPGVTWHLSAYREPFTSVNAAYYPPESPVSDEDWASAYPVLRRYIDSHQLIPMNESTVREMAAVASAFGLMRDASLVAPLSEPLYAWEPGGGGSTSIYRLNDIPVADVPLLTPVQITAFGAEAVLATDDRLAALTPAQVAAIDAPTVPYWVAKLSLTQQFALTAAQISAFEQWSLLTALPAELVPLIPAEKMPLIGTHLRETSAAWKAAVTPAQLDAMTLEQREIMAQADQASCSTGTQILEDLRLSGEDQSFSSEKSISVTGTVEVGTQSVLTLAAPIIRFQPGFRVVAGGQLRAIAGLVTCLTPDRRADTTGSR